MASFQNVILGIAVVIFVICLILIFISLKNEQKNMTWPPYVPSCPDYWVDVSGNNCLNPKNLGTCSLTSMNFDTLVGEDGSSNVTAANCAKYKWANQCGLAWEGITYGYGKSNPCDQLSDQLTGNQGSP
jgi:hypothetical protein